ncbi:MAG: pantoate--beta-alanine ligase [Candidatus Hydrogenedentes bacterium]|nr:pantoate--beta-alanine ligase [Candidatus Hydrogenedentota bacterium]
MKVIREAEEMRHWSRGQLAARRSVGLVPTMGALHAGHTSLIDASVAQDDVTIVSIFVNPAQFAPHEDYDTYPRDFDEDCAKLESLRATVIYAPSAESMYAKDYATYVEVERLQEGLCGGARPHFFRGVATVVVKLFNTVLPDRAYFGEKDGQQAAIIRRMVRDLDFGVEIVILPTVREADGLAMSSRNAYLSSGERERALSISRALFEAQEMLEAGERKTQRILAPVREAMGGLEIDYITLVDADELTPVQRIEGRVMLAVAAQIGKTRLIDNIQFDAREIKEPAPTRSRTSRVGPAES